MELNPPFLPNLPLPDKIMFLDSQPACPPTDRPFLFFKVGIFLLVLLGLFIGKTYLMPEKVVSTLQDPLHDFLEDANQAINGESILARSLMISSSLLMDLSFLTVYTYWY